MVDNSIVAPKYSVLLKYKMKKGFLVYLFLFAVMIVILSYSTFTGFQDYLSGSYTYKDDIISEWLINYMGGGVRRGLIGQLLYFLYQLHPYPVADVIVCLFFAGFMFLTALLVKIFIERGWSVFLLPFPCCLFTFLGYRFMISRRDAWMLLLAFTMFYLYKKYHKDKSTGILISMNMMMVIGMLIYESIIFFVFPIVFIHYVWMQSRNNDLIFGGCKSIVMWLPTLLMPFAIVLMAGTPETTTLLFQSWGDLFRRYPMCEPFAVEDIYVYEWIGQPLIKHIQGVFVSGWTDYAIGTVPRWIFNLYLFPSVYFLVTRLNTIDIRLFKLKPYDTVQLSNIVILQFLFLLPYMLLLSCDMARNITYWTVSSFMFFYFFGNSENFIPWVTRLSQKIQGKIERNVILSHPYTYLAVLLTLPLEFHGGGVKMLIPVIPQEIKHYIMSCF